MRRGSELNLLFFHKMSMRRGSELNLYSWIEGRVMYHVWSTRTDHGFTRDLLSNEERERRWKWGQAEMKRHCVSEPFPGVPIEHGVDMDI